MLDRDGRAIRDGAPRARREQPALRRIDELIETRPVVSWINLVEVYYRIERDHGRAAADEALVALRRTLSPDLPGTGRMIEAARLKARTDRSGKLLRRRDRRGARRHAPDGRS